MDPKRAGELKKAAGTHFDGSRYKGPLSAEELGQKLKVLQKERLDFLEVLAELEEEGITVHVDGRGWCSPRREGWVVGTIKVSRKGFGFVRPVRDDPKGDLYISSRKLKDAHNGDLVLVKPLKPGRKKQRDSRGDNTGREGRVVDVVRRSPRIIVGVYYRGFRGGGVVEPIAHESLREIYVPGGKEQKASDGARVLARLTEGDTVGGLPPGEVVELAEPEGTWKADLQLIAAEYDLTDRFPDDVLAEAKAFPTQIPPSLIEARHDIRDQICFTIDPRDAKDYDDALTLERLRGGRWRVGVMIADVAHYVIPGSALDREALRRGTSVYLPGKTFPMLPPRLSENLCSLRPDTDRLAKAVWMEISREGDLESWEIERVVMRSHRCFSYAEAQEILDGADGADGDDPEITAMLRHMGRLHRLLRRKRLERGALDLDIPEQRILLDDVGEVLEIGVREREDANRLVEEFMLLANEAVARAATDKKIPIIRRIHPTPPEDDVENFLKFCRVLVPGIAVSGPESFQKLVETVADRPEATVVNSALLRTLTRAEYSPHAALHFALACDEYCHFTSPIRRYPDLQVHQALDALLFGDRPAPRGSGGLPQLQQVSEQCSANERAADEAEREMSKLRAISWLRHREGEDFTGIITGVFDFGLFVRLEENMTEGMIHISSLKDDFYVLNESQFALRGRNTGKSLRLGDRIEVQLVRADPISRKIDFPVSEAPESKEVIVMTIQLYTDGACRGNPGPGGWGAILRMDGEEQELYGAEMSTTNNRMELRAAIEGLLRTPEGAAVEVLSDSQYVVKGMTEWIVGWKRRGWVKADKKPVMNADLWQELDALAAARTVRWGWVRGHDGHEENERCDQLANLAIDQI